MSGSSVNLNINALNTTTGYPQLPPIVVNADSSVSVNISVDPNTKKNVVTITNNSLTPAMFPNTNSDLPPLYNLSVLLGVLSTGDFYSLTFDQLQTLLFTDAAYPVASPGSPGVVTIGNTLTIDSNGILNVISSIANVSANFTASFQQQLNNKLDQTTTAIQNINGLLNINQGVVINSSLNMQSTVVNVSGPSTIIIPNRKPIFAINAPYNTITSLTVVMPAAAQNGDCITVTTNATLITEISFVTTVVGQTITASPSSLTSITPIRFTLINNNWFLI